MTLSDPVIYDPMRIGGFLPTTLLDFPGHLACTIFTQGCNLRCPFCQNGALVLPELFEEPLSEEDILSKIRKRSGILEGVCISGGEPTLQPDLTDFICSIKSLGLLVKLDTNGCRPEFIKNLIDDRLIDYVAMDVKSAPSHYSAVCGFPEKTGTSAEDFYRPYRESIELLKTNVVDYEFRTTLVKGLHTAQDIRELASLLSGAQAWYLQSYEESGRVIALLEHNKDRYDSFTPSELQELLSLAQSGVPAAALRGVAF